MCQTCGCEPCKKCGKQIKDAKCSGCNKPANQCTCQPVKSKKQ